MLNKYLEKDFWKSENNNKENTFQQTFGNRF